MNATDEDRGVLFRQGCLGKRVVVISGAEGRRAASEHLTISEARVVLARNGPGIKPAIYERSEDCTWTQVPAAVSMPRKTVPR